MTLMIVESRTDEKETLVRIVVNRIPLIPYFRGCFV